MHWGDLIRSPGATGSLLGYQYGFWNVPSEVAQDSTLGAMETQSPGTSPSAITGARHSLLPNFSNSDIHCNPLECNFFWFHLIKMKRSQRGDAARVHHDEQLRAGSQSKVMG